MKLWLLPQKKQVKATEKQFELLQLSNDAKMLQLERKHEIKFFDAIMTFSVFCTSHFVATENVAQKLEKEVRIKPAKYQNEPRKEMHFLNALTQASLTVCSYHLN